MRGGAHALLPVHAGWPRIAQAAPPICARCRRRAGCGPLSADQACLPLFPPLADTPGVVRQLNWGNALGLLNVTAGTTLALDYVASVGALPALLWQQLACTCNVRAFDGMPSGLRDRLADAADTCCSGCNAAASDCCGTPGPADPAAPLPCCSPRQPHAGRGAAAG